MYSINPMSEVKKMSPDTKLLWGAAGVLGVAVGLAYLHPPDFTRDPTPAERSQVDQILRHAAVDAARAAIKSYSKHPGRASLEKPASSLPHPLNGAELYVNSKKYLIIVDLQKGRKGLDANTAYNVDIFEGVQSGGLTISELDLNGPAVSLGHEFLFASTADGSTTADLLGQTTNSRFKQTIDDAETIAAIVENDIKEFNKG